MGVVRKLLIVFGLMVCLVLGTQFIYGKTYVELQKGKSYFVAVSPAKYDYPKFAHSIVVLFEKQSNYWEKVGHQLLDPKWDTQGIAVNKGKIFILNHRSEYISAVLAFDINSFFQTNPSENFEQEPLLKINNVERPISIMNDENKLSITFAGLNNTNNGIFIYDLVKLRKGDITPVTKIIYKKMGMNIYSPADSVFYRGNLIVSNHYRGNISVFDISKANPTVRTIKTGFENKLYYPLGLAIHNDLLFVGDHIHYFISVFDLSNLDDIKPLRTFGGAKSLLHMPFHLATFDNTVFATNMLPPQSVSAYKLSSKGEVNPEYIIKKNKDTLLNAPSDIKFFIY